jgi:cobalt-zinc-cadmium resistance protein CzcA
MLTKIIKFSLNNKVTVLLFTALVVVFGIYSLRSLHIGAVPDVTNNQVQVITTSKNLSTEDMEQFITYPIELEMANLPGVEEIRSVSKFGLSVVTIVFEDDLGTYLPRQLISEKLQGAVENIPQGFGTPEMGPISTGLGEIYQYVLDLKPGYENVYSTTDLRTIQDWIVKRQLSGIPGVVEVNTWGGYLKQYEVSIDTDKLMAMDITASDVFRALESNNSIAGGGYIEKKDMAYFIRGEGLLKSLEDIRNISIKTVNGLPVHIKDVAEVGYGSANRFGAITGNGEGEKVLGQVMMIKDGNSNQVIQDVKARVNEISGNLPEGVYINGFLERSELIGRTTFTVTENLVLGCLIVIFVVVLLLGNMRSGLIIASIIPITLLFALSLMNIFDIDANLMSLGAIDFGIIIDGSVIIVEFVAFKISKQISALEKSEEPVNNAQIDEITLQSASKMMNSAIFGQLIILIVFIPILSLEGVEGKMFRPMALTFSFALIGAMILCLTYVPVMSSLILKPKGRAQSKLSKKIIEWLYTAYEPFLHQALKFRKTVIASAVGLVLFAGFLFSTMGAEFVPTLDEGDFVIQPVLKTGTSLSETIEITTRIEALLLEQFPEVDQVVSRIGAAEIPTDPMSMEESDVIIKLKPKSQWTSARTKDELADRMKQALSIFPDMEIEFTQPIEMRFNELITGVRADIAVKIFGEDLEILSGKGQEIAALIRSVEGASDVTPEKIEGLPQVEIRYDRRKIARYGMSIKEVNRMIAMSFSGAKTGDIFEGEKRFDLVVRLKKDKRENLSNLSNLYIDTPAGFKVPLGELADINFIEGPAKISRDETKRRIVVGVNVRNRDLQSVVDDIQKIIEERVQLPPGYSITYGGQFENLNRARKRLMLAVPVALALIFVMLYFAFDSLREASLIFTAIPLAAVGGVFLLWLRGMPFSISAGIGFIALFGIAVLNGIVLIEYFKELKNKGFTDMKQIIYKGTKDRMRPVILTALAAALGFLPMAVSTNVGAEVQRPLATVVIGGLATSTLLTLIVLPVLYSIVQGGRGKGRERKGMAFGKTSVFIILFFIGIGSELHSQEIYGMDLDSLLELALSNNAGFKANSLRMEEADALVSSAFDFDKTEIYYQYDENNLALNGLPLKVFGLGQEFLFPTVYFAGKKVNQANLNLETSTLQLKRLELEKKVVSEYYRLQYELEKESIYKRLDSFYISFAHAAKRRFETGETNYLERITAQAKQRQLRTLYQQSREDVKSALLRLQELVQSDDSLAVARIPLRKVVYIEVSIEENPGIEYQNYRTELFRNKKNFESQRLLPDISLNYFRGTNSRLDEYLNGYQIGLKFPILFSGNSSRIKASKIARQIAEQEAIDYRIRLETRRSDLLLQLNKYDQMLSYYQDEGENLSQEIFKTAKYSFENGEINFFQYLQSIENALEILLDYMQNLNQYNQTAIELNYLTL